MKHNSNPKRGRGRSGGRRSNYGPNRTYDSNGPDVKVRGTATQVCDRYLALARDASSSGDRIKAEGYLQHAEHYYRVVHGDDGQQGQSQGQGQGQEQDKTKSTEKMTRQGEVGKTLLLLYKTGTREVET